jgi:mannitol/fructose-specific phosphotransferase system IIA component (Ntr-type)
MFTPHSQELVRLVFLLVTPKEKPDLQLSLLAQIARIAGDPAARDRLRRATSKSDVIEATLIPQTELPLRPGA